MLSRSFAACVIVGFVLVSAAGAHHAPAVYDLTITEFALTGTIKSVEFRNPHSEMELLVKDEQGQVREWKVEFSSINLLLRRGWKSDRIKPGDVVTVSGNPAKSKDEALMYMWAIRLADGTVYKK